MSIQVLPNGTVKVLVPWYVPTWSVKVLLKQKESWIQETREKMLSRLPKEDMDTYLYLGKTYQLATRSGQKELIELEDKFYLGVTTKRNAKTYLTSWYKQQARKIIVERVHLYAKHANVTFRSVSITTAETRWGSCSNNKTLNFNWKLVMAPMEVIDYVIAHELAHLTELNHSRAFWETVRKIYPLYREYRTWLKRNGHRLVV